MKDFKQNTKMACEGNHYNSGGKIKKMAAGGKTNDGMKAEGRNREKLTNQFGSTGLKGKGK